MEDWLFNMGKTGFLPKNKSKKVMAVSVSINMWSKSVEEYFQMTMTAEFSEYGFVSTCVLILPSKKLKSVDMYLLLLLNQSTCPNGMHMVGRWCSIP